MPTRRTPASVTMKFIATSYGCGWIVPMLRSELPAPIVREHLQAGRLHFVKGAPEFSHPAYAVHPASADTGGFPCAGGAAPGGRRLVARGNVRAAAAQALAARPGAAA